MSAELWKEWMENRCLQFANPDLPIADVDGWLSVLGEWEHKLDSGDRHALGAVCLHQQPYGFTHDDPYILREVAETIDKLCDGPKMVGIARIKSEMGEEVSVYYYVEHLQRLADRIEALLPPNQVEDPTYEGEDGG